MHLTAQNTATVTIMPKIIGKALVKKEYSFKSISSSVTNEDKEYQEKSSAISVIHKSASKVKMPKNWIIGANANEAAYGISTADFIAKLQISLKETAETEYWLRLLILTEYLEKEHGDSILSDCLEIKRILISSLNTAKKKQEIHK